MTLKQIKLQIVKLKLHLLAWFAIKFLHIKGEHLEAKCWKSSKMTTLYVILGKEVPLWMSQALKDNPYGHGILLFIANDLTRKIYNDEIGLDISNNKQPYYFKTTPSILYLKRETKLIRKIIKLQATYNLSYEHTSKCK